MSTPAPRTAVCGIVVLRADGAALLQHRDDIPTIQDPGLWVFPGGHLESDETPAGGAAREFEEETGYRCARLLPLADFHRTELGCQGDFRMIFCWDVSDGRQRIECREGQAAAFGVKFRKTGQIGISGFREGAIREAINYAGSQKLAVLFVCENDRHATFSDPLKRQTEDNICERGQQHRDQRAQPFAAHAIRRLLQHDKSRPYGFAVRPRPALALHPLPHHLLCVQDPDRVLMVISAGHRKFADDARFLLLSLTFATGGGRRT